MIRPYQPQDRAPLRDLCCDTGHNGQPIDPIFPSRDIFADYWTSYYTDHEPGAVWVSEDNGALNGYVAGTFNPSRHRRAMKYCLFPKLLAKTFLRGKFFHPKVWSIVLSAWSPQRPQSSELVKSLSSPTAHLHINVNENARGQGIGPKLLESFEQNARQQGMMSVTAETREDNSPARQFFERAGYQVAERKLGYRVRGQSFNVLVYGKDLTT